jgi:Zn ribbon nucleic-acid-binding protein
MKAISIKQPWASLIAHGIKDIENRTWKTNFRGKIYIHASAKSAGNTAYLLNDQQNNYFVFNTENYKTFESNLPYSAIIGEVEIVDCVINHTSIWADQMRTYKDDEVDIQILCRNQKYIWNWVLANAILYDKPILDVKGKLSFWEPDLDLIECIGCGQPVIQSESLQDEGENDYHQECYREMLQVLIQESKQNI